MPFSFYNPPTLSPEQVNPFNAALKQAFQTYGQGLKAGYAKQNIEQSLQKMMAETLYKQTEAKKLQFLMAHPEYINPQSALISMALQNQGRGGTPGGSSDEGALTPRNTPRATGEPIQGDFGEQNRATDAEVGEHVARTTAGLPTGQGTQNAAQAGAPMDLGGGVTGTPVAEVGTAYTPAMAQQQNQQQQSSVNTQQYHPSTLAYNPPNVSNPTGNPALAGAWYKNFGMDPTTQSQLNITEKQADNYNKIMNDKNQTFSVQANLATQAANSGDKFLNALNRSYAIERGAIGGGRTALTNAAQEMDTYANQMAGYGAQAFDPGHAIHESSVEFQQSQKAGRKLNKDVAFDLAHNVIENRDRLNERQQAYAYAQHPIGSPGPLRTDLVDSAYNLYDKQRPPIDPVTHLPNDAYKGTWKDYFTPEAINAISQGKNYIPSTQQVLKGMNWSEKDLKNYLANGKKMGVEKQYLSKHGLYDLAKNENKTLSQVKMELIQAGVL